MKTYAIIIWLFKMFIKKLSFILFITFFIQVTSVNVFAFTGGCNENKYDYKNNLFFFKLQLEKGESKSTPWEFSADYGGHNECKEFMRTGHGKIKKEMPAAQKWGMGYSTLHRHIISKNEFCNSKGPFSMYGLGKSAHIEFCNNIVGSSKFYTEINLSENDFEIICDLLDCANKRRSGDNFSEILEEFIKKGSDYAYPYLAVSMIDLQANDTVSWGMDVTFTSAIEVCEEYSDTRCDVIIANGKIVNDMFLNKFQNRSFGTASFIENPEPLSAFSNNDDVRAKLEKLKSLYDDDLIDQTLYEQKKAEILGSF